MGKASNVLNALAIGIGGAMQGYGQGTLTVALRNRDEYYDRLREERSAARDAATTAGSQKFQKELASDTREFQTGQADIEWERDKEKMGMQEASKERELRLAASLRPKGEGRQPSAEMQEVNTVAAVLARQAGLEKATDAIWMQAYEKVNASKSSSGSKEPAAWELQKRIAAGELGRDPTDAEVSARFKPQGEKVSAAQYLQMLQSEEKAFMGEIQNMDKSPEEAAAAATERVNAKLDAMGAEYPKKAGALAPKTGQGSSGSWDYQGSAEPASKSPQESVNSVEQPGVLDAPATSALGDKPTDATPRGEGSERSPFIVDTPEEQAWFLENAPAGSWVVYKGQRGQK